MHAPLHSHPGDAPNIARPVPGQLACTAEPAAGRDGATSLIGAFIFDVDGVIADTATMHEAAWRQLAEEHGLPFDEAAADNLRGLSREASLRSILGDREVSPETFAEMAEQKNRRYLELLDRLTSEDVLPGVRTLLGDLADMGIKLAVVSMSRNARSVLLRTGIVDAFDIVIDGNDLAGFKSELNRYQRAAKMLRVEPGRCVVVEDSTAGIAAARGAGMRSIGVGDPDRLCAATLVFESLRGVRAATLLQWLIQGTRPD